jgi:hypothetical protein
VIAWRNAVILNEIYALLEAIDPAGVDAVRQLPTKQPGTIEHSQKILATLLLIARRMGTAAQRQAGHAAFERFLAAHPDGPSPVHQTSEPERTADPVDEYATARFGPRSS